MVQILGTVTLFLLQLYTQPQKFLPYSRRNPLERLYSRSANQRVDKSQQIHSFPNWWILMEGVSGIRFRNWYIIMKGVAYKTDIIACIF